MEFYERKSPRLSGYDYSNPNYYFVTICSYEKKCIFGTPGKLNSFGMIAQKCIEEISEVFPDVLVDKFVVMPNHVHLIVVIGKYTEKKELPNLSMIVRQYKSAVSKRIHKYGGIDKVWQRSFHDHIIRNQKNYEKIWLYIADNPRKWDEDCFFQENYESSREGQ